MDERRFEELLNDTVGEPPEASFTVDDVTTASRRITAKRRSLVTGVAAIVVLAGSAVGIVVSNTGADRPTSTALSGDTGVSGQIAEDPEKSSESGQPGDGGERDQSVRPHPGAQSFPDDSPKQGGEPTGEDGPRAEGTPGCDVVDRELATALAGELPINPVGDAVRSPHCASAASSAAFSVAGGTVSALVLPPDSANRLPGLPRNSTLGQAQTADGRTVVVISSPVGDGHEAPVAGAVDSIAVALADDL